ncbi:hypothetical protein ACWEIJ_28200 [Lentzea sp. NPDC004789]
MVDVCRVSMSSGHRLDIRGGSAQLVLHVDCFPEHDYLDESAEPLVIALTR